MTEYDLTSYESFLARIKYARYVLGNASLIFASSFSDEHPIIRTLYDFQRKEFEKRSAKPEKLEKSF